MKPFQSYIFEINKPGEFRIKLANIDPKTVMEQIKNALNTWQLESVSAVKSLPIQEHREFPQWGPCECWQFDVKLAYPTTSIAVRQTIKERAQINVDWINVRNLNEAIDTDEANREAGLNGGNSASAVSTGSGNSDDSSVSKKQVVFQQQRQPEAASSLVTKINRSADWQDQISVSVSQRLLVRDAAKFRIVPRSIRMNS